MARAYFQVYFSYEEPLKSLTYEQIGKIFMAMFQYEKTKEKDLLCRPQKAMSRSVF